ncbi:adenylosuccinate synthase [bacterium]|nr:adenylosuccinate synthase [bacterium]
MQVYPNKSSSVRAVIGTQWGDEGKGKVVDLISDKFDIVARFQGGPNAGHTVKFDNKTFILHHIPTGILRPDVSCVLGNGMVINAESLLNEIKQLQDESVDVLSRLYISQNAHLIMPYHIKLDSESETSASSEEMIGTTGRGIGPAYADKAERTGIRMGDLLNPAQLEKKIRSNVKFKNEILKLVYKTEGCNADEILDGLLSITKIIGKNIIDTREYLYKSYTSGKNILLEGAQGTHLDIDFGTYPFVTSSNTIIGGAFTGLGLGPGSISEVIGIMKAYTTRVGNGPFPTEISDKLGEEIRKIGGEYGATTGRPRRCGWWDGIVSRFSAEINSLDYLAITKLDVLDSLKSIKLCTGYKVDGKILNYLPTDPELIVKIEPVYEEMEGWNTSISGVRQYNDLPDNAKKYLHRIEEITGVEILMVSVGPRRKETIWKKRLS